MNDAPLPVTGACRCGQTTFEVSAPAVMTSACHCRGCQRMSASAFSLSAMFPATAFRITKGSPVKGGSQGPDLDHFFCPSCKTWMFTRIVAWNGVINLRPTLFDDPRWCRPFMETMTREKLPWAEPPAEHSFAGYPTAGEFEMLLAAFARSV